MKYQVELTAFVEATFVIEVDAEDEQNAKQYAVERAPSATSRWTVLSSGQIKQIEVFSCEESE